MTIHDAAVTPTVPAARQPQAAPLLLRPLRLRLQPTAPLGKAKALVGGAWWPYTDNLITELTPLLAGMAERGYAVHRISYSLSAWQDVPRKVHLAGTLIRLGGYRTQSAAVLHLIDSSGKAPLVLMVIPPDTTPAAAEKALQLGATSTVLDAAAALEAATR